MVGGLLDVREWPVGPPGCSEVVGKTSWMSGSGREALPNVREWWEALHDVLLTTPGHRGVVGKTSRMSGSSREILPDVREWSGGLPECPGVVDSFYQMCGSGRETLPDVWEALLVVRE